MWPRIGIQTLPGSPSGKVGLCLPIPGTQFSVEGPDHPSEQDLQLRHHKVPPGCDPVVGRNRQLEGHFSKLGKGLLYFNDTLTSCWASGWWPARGLWHPHPPGKSSKDVQTVGEKIRFPELSVEDTEHLVFSWSKGKRWVWSPG